MESGFSLSNSRFMSGLRCPKLLWWSVHEPNSPELGGDEDLAAAVERAKRVRELARTYVPGGVFIDLPRHKLLDRVKATRRALASGATRVYDAAFLDGGVFVSVDILQRRGDGFALIDVKSALDVKDEHILAAALRFHIVGRSGLLVKRAEVMHLNRECRYPDLSNLFVREGVTSRVRQSLRTVPQQIESLGSILAGPLPLVATGRQCTSPSPCPFFDRCWLKSPQHHVNTLYGIRSGEIQKLIDSGYETLLDLPRSFRATGPARRQLRSVRTGEVIVGRGLLRALRALAPPIAFLDFETINPAVPVWRGCGPYAQVPVQFSCHVMTLTGPLHHAWIADGPDDPREAFAHALIGACANSRTVLAYNAPFERRCIEGLISAFPHLKNKLRTILRRLDDLLPIVRDHVYHPDFQGSFSIKDVLPALVPGLGARRQLDLPHSDN